MFISIRVKIQDSIDNYNASDDSYIQCLYEDEDRDLEHIEKGF